MQLKSVNDNDIEILSSWLIKKENYKWLDFGRGVQKLEIPVIKLMNQREIHELRLFTPDDGDNPIGLVALSDISQKFKTAVLWYLLGDKNYSGMNYTTRAASELLSIGFSELGLDSILAWTIEENIASRKVLEKNNFRYIGRRRKCHYIDDKAYDRIYFDLVTDEHISKKEMAKEGGDILHDKIINLLHNELDLKVSATDTDLLENGYLDSLLFIQLMAVLEEEFDITVSIDDLDFESFATVKNIALFVQKLTSK